MNTLKIVKISDGIFKHILNDVNDQAFYNTESCVLSIDLGTIALSSGNVTRNFSKSNIQVFDINSSTAIVINTVDDLVIALNNLGYPLLYKKNGNSSGGGGTAVDRELVVTTYYVKTAFTGASVGDTVTATQVIDVTAAPTTVSTVWRNQSIGLDLAAAPSASDLTLLGSQALTDAQLRAAAVSVLPSMESGGNIAVTTASTGTNYTAFASQSCKQLTLSNQSGVVIEVRQGGSGVALQIPTGAFYTFFGLTNTNQLDVRRVDTSNTQITLTARWEL